MEKPECKLIGENGNVFNLIGIVKRTLRKEGLNEELKSFDIELTDMMKNGSSYDDILMLFQKYVEVV